MKKQAISVIALLLCAVSVFLLAACHFEKILENADYTEDAEAVNKEDSIKLINAFFEETLKDPNFVATCKNKDGEVQFTETVKGTDCYTLSNDGTKVYAYKKDGFFYLATVSMEEDEEGNACEQRYYYCSDSTKRGYYEDSEFGTMEALYQGNYCSFMSQYNGVNIVELLPEEKGTYNCKTHGEKKNGVITGSLNFIFTAGEGTVTITASSEENKVRTLRIATSDGADLTWTFAYGNASITLPDTDAWDREVEESEARERANSQALDERSEFFLETTCAPNVTVTVAENGETAYVETIAGNVDRVAYDTCTIYTFMKEVDEETTDYYYVFDGEEKYYSVNDENYDNNILFYYYCGIEQYDVLDEAGAAFSCTTKGDTLTFTITMDGRTVATLVAVRTDNMVREATCTTVTEDGTKVTTYTFEYGSATVEEPELTNFEYVTDAMDLSDFQCSYANGKITIVQFKNREATAVEIPEGVTAIGDWAFFGCEALESVTMPESLTELGFAAFSGCTALTNLSLPENLISIGDRAFSECRSLTTFVIPNATTHIGDGAFESCDRLQYNVYENGFYLGSANEPYLVFIKPESREITTFVLNDHTKYIHSSAFAECSSLASIAIPASVSHIGSDAFRKCSALTAIVIPEGVASIELRTFQECLALKSVTLPESVEEIGQFAFYKCPALESILLPAGVTQIADAAFAGCTALKNVAIPESVTRIGFGAFSSCPLLESAVIPNGVERIWFETFDGCTALKTITIPATVKKIGSDAFRNCTSLAKIVFTGTVDEWNQVVKDTGWHLNVPAGKVECSNGNVDLA